MTVPNGSFDYLHWHYQTTQRMERYANRCRLFLYSGAAAAFIASVALKWKPFTPGALSSARLLPLLGQVIISGFLICAAHAFASICAHQRRLVEANLNIKTCWKL